MIITTEEAERLAEWCSVGLPIIAIALRSLAAERDALKAEVERLKAGGCARDQSTTQFCAEAVALQAENAKLREALRYYADDNYNGYNGNGAHARAALGEKK